MRHILGFLNQSEWILSLNIGNIMQSTPIQLEDLASLRRNEQELDRFAFLETVSFLCVGYFCVSTEIRFIIQLKEEIGSFKEFDVAKKQNESEFWHTKSLEVACSFLPSDCPLLNHILLSYQKHHAPSQSSIPENINTSEYLRVVKPVPGIENCRFRPIVRTIENAKINLTPIKFKLAKYTVNKMLKEIQPKSNLTININQGGQLNSRFGTTPEANMQQSAGIKPGSRSSTQQDQARPGGEMNRDKIKKIMKFEKIIQKFCDRIGIEKNNLLSILQPEKSRQDGTVQSAYESLNANQG